MAKKETLSAPPAPTPVPTPTPTQGNDVLPVVEGEGTPEGTTPAENDTVPEGQGAGNKLPGDIEPPVPTPTSNTGEEVQPEVGGKPIKDAEFPVGSPFEGLPSDDGMTKQTLDDDEQNAVADEAFQTLVDEPFDPSTNLGDWDNDGKAGGSVPVPKLANEKTNAELGEEVGIVHAQNNDKKPARQAFVSLLEDNETLKGNLPNGNALDGEFWTAYDQAFDRERDQLAADELSDEDRLRRVEKTLGLLSPRD